METVSSKKHAVHPWYVTGFVEGEGTFTYNRASGRGALSLVFGVKLTAKDHSLLLMLQDYFACGHLYGVKPRAPLRGSGWSKRASYYKVTRIRDLVRIVQHFDRYPLFGEKKVGYGIWRQMVMLKADNFRRPPREELERLAEALSAAAPRNQPWSAKEPSGRYGR